MSASSGSRRGTAAGCFSRCPDFVRELCAACLRASMQTKDQATGKARSKRSPCTCAEISIWPQELRYRFASQNSVHHNVVLPAGA